MYEKSFDLRNERQSEVKRYSLPDKNVISFDENSEIRQRNEQCRQGLHEAGIELPVEIQGCGASNFETREFTVGYPKGDIFASWAVTIHELGHLRQAERHGYKKLEDIPENMDTETDAWETGWKITEKFAPKILENLEKQFQKVKTSGLLNSHLDFMHFFDYFKKMNILLHKACERIPKNIDPFSEESGRLLAEEIKKDDELLDFFIHQEQWKVGEIIDQEEVERYIKMVAERIAEEVY